ncbi:hypothetical protein ACWIUA_07965 [Ursidibacter sp. B-7004-1]
MIRFEYEKPYKTRCDCCDKAITNLTRFVYEDRTALAYYYANLEEHFEDKFVDCLVVFCDFDEHNEIVNRTAFPIKIWQDVDNFYTSLRNKDESPWADLDKLDDIIILNRKESLVHPLKQKVFDISDQIVRIDLQVIEYLNSK